MILATLCRKMSIFGKTLEADTKLLCHPPLYITFSLITTFVSALPCYQRVS